MFSSSNITIGMLVPLNEVSEVIQQFTVVFQLEIVPAESAILKFNYIMNLIPI